jgi:hypothetical protein
MEWTEVIVIECIELYKRKEIIWDPKHPMHFNPYPANVEYRVSS